MTIKSESTLYKIALFEFQENIRNRWLLIYGLAIFLFSSVIMYFGSDRPSQAIMSLLNLILLVVPLFSSIFGAVSFTESLPFMEIILSKNVSRRELFFGKWLGLGTGLCISYLAAVVLSSVLFLPPMEKQLFSWALIVFSGILLSLIFLSLSFLVSNLLNRKELIQGVILLFWFYFYILYDLILLGLAVLYRHYPLDILLLVMTFLNPLDLVRLMALLQMDLSALMGFGTAVFQKVLGNFWGIATGIMFLALWVFIPLNAGYRTFKRREI